MNINFQERTKGFPPRLLQSLLSCLTQDISGHMLVDLQHDKITELDAIAKAITYVFGLSCYAFEFGPHTLPSALYNSQSELILDVNMDSDWKSSNACYVAYPPEAKLNLEEIGKVVRKMPKVNSSQNNPDITSSEPDYTHKGPIFHNIFIAHRLDLAPIETQAVVLQSMKAKNISIEGTLHRMPKTHVVMATFADGNSNIQYSLSAQLAQACLLSIVSDPGLFNQLIKFSKLHASILVSQSTPVHWQFIKSNSNKVFVADSILQYIRDIVVCLSHHNQVVVGPSYRAQICLLNMAKMHALYSGVTFVRPIDIVGVAVQVLAHHVTLNDDFSPFRVLGPHGHEFHSLWVTYKHRSHTRVIIDHIVRKVTAASKD